MPDPKDADLVAGLRRGEALAFDRAYDRYHRRIYSFLVRLAGRRDVADDLYQETWMQLCRHATGLAEDTDLPAWLYTVARNRFRSHRRTAVLRGMRLREFFSRDDKPDGGPSPYEAAAAQATAEQLERALHRLSADHREVLLLLAGGLAQEQVAQVLSIRPDAVRQRLSRARAQLLMQLGKEKDDGT